MNLLLDTHFVLAFLSEDTLNKNRGAGELRSGQHKLTASVVSLWEIAIKFRLGKVNPGVPLDLIADFLGAAKVDLLSINRRHAIANAEPEPATRDPFDRMLLAQCQVEDMFLVTKDRALAGHPLAWSSGMTSLGLYARGAN